MAAPYFGGILGNWPPKGDLTAVWGLNKIALDFSRAL
jgi:hypothetical protein